MKYEILKAGDVRKKGDEVRSLTVAINDARHNPKMDPAMDVTRWRRTELVGQEILPCDLFDTELRRPIK